MPHETLCSVTTLINGERALPNMLKVRHRMNLCVLVGRGGSVPVAPVPQPLEACQRFSRLKAFFLGHCR